MDSMGIILELKNLSEQDKIIKSQLLAILKKYARTITIYDFMRTSQRMRKEGEYLDEEYREHFLEIYIKNFLLRITELIALEEYDDVDIDKDLMKHFPYLRECLKKKNYLVLKETNSHYFM